MSVWGMSSSEGWDVLGFGAAAVDDLIYVDHVPTRAVVERFLAEHGIGT